MGAFFGLLLVSVAARAGIRIRTRRSLFLDDYVVVFGLACLIGATGVLYYDMDSIFVFDALDRQPALLAYIALELNRLLLSLNYLDVFLALIWTTTFAVKFSFLAFFHQLIDRVTRIRVYYWTGVTLTLLSWAFFVSEPLILCRKFGLDASQLLIHQPSALI